jgi:DNA-3-methyladenine glycosylase II
VSTFRRHHTGRKRQVSIRIRDLELDWVPEGYFAALVRSIAFQQLAGRAAPAIHGRFLANFPGGLQPGAGPRAARAGLPQSRRLRGQDRLHAAPPPRSWTGTVPLDGLEAYSDDEIVESCHKVRGIGRWVAQMFLIFQLRRPDVWPVDNHG